MKVRILGCSGGIGGQELRTTSFLIDHDMLVDCGTGVGDLALDELVKIDHLFLTHSHLDHIAMLPLLIDAVCDLRDRPLVVHATEQTIEVLRAHVFNWAVWPDFSEIPSMEESYLRFEPIQVGETIDIEGRRLTALPTNHTVPTVGYQLDSGMASLVFTGDTGPCADLWNAINSIENLRYLIVETAFPDSEQRRAAMSKHLSPAILADELRALRRPVELYITHLKPGRSEATMQEIVSLVGFMKPRMLRNGQVLEL